MKAFLIPLVRGLFILAAFALLLSARGAAAEPSVAAALIDTDRLMYDPNFAGWDVQGWLAKHKSALAELQQQPGDPATSYGALIGAAAARDGINPKVLLTWLEMRGGLASATPTFGLPGDFHVQTDRASKLLREGMLPDQLGKPYGLSDGTNLSAVPFTDPGSYALSRALAAGATRDSWRVQTSSDPAGFVATYQRLFGEDPRRMLPLAPTTDPFLTPPFYAPFEHRSYFDHTFPTVDYGSDNYPVMTSYDGQLGRLYDTHDGHDYIMTIGTPVYAAAPGTAYFLRSNDCGDPNTQGVLIRHADGYETIYWHMSSLSGPAGTNRLVNRGDWLGNSGQSGCASSAPHLHFELRHNGLESDPYGWSGAGPDPCPGLASGPSGYRGCEASTYLWQTAPDGPAATITPLPTITPTSTPTTAPPGATATPGCDGSATYSSNDVNKPIPPSGTVGTTTSRLTIADATTINTVRVVSLSIQHSYASDLEVTLISPAGSRVRLFSNVCQNTAWNAANTGFTLGDNGATTMGVTCPPGPQVYRPISPLTALAGQSAAGTWTLEVVDSDNYDSGALLGWGLEINGANCAVPPTAAPTTAPGGCGTNFSDVQASDYFYEPVRYLLCRGVISGYSDNTFHPFDQVTRAQLLKMVALADGWSLSTPASPTFHDAGPSDWFYPYVETAAAKQVVSGYNDGTFRPFSTVNRGQTAKIVALSAGWFLVTPSSPTFSDVPTTNPYFQFVETAVLRRVMSGYADSTFHPFELAIRAQIAKILYTRLNP